MSGSLRVQSVVHPETSKSYFFPSPDEIRDRVKRARSAQILWQSKSVSERKAVLGRLRSLIVERMDEISSEIHLWMGKPAVDAVLNEIIPTLEILKFNEKQAEKALRTEKRPTTLSFPKSKSFVEYHPMGVVLVFSPWNFPFQLSIVPAATALLAGNAVVLKMSEVALPIGEIIETLFREAGVPKDLVTVVPGDPGTGENLIDAKPDLIFLTGSPATGKKVMERASKYLIPVLLELGGKDPMIVFNDAPFERAVNGAVYGAFACAGQVCVSVERCYVEDGVADRFINAVGERVRKIRLGLDNNSDIGMVTTDKQVDLIRDHIDDAKRKGAVAVSEPKFEGRWVSPVVLRNTNHEMKIMTEETFGPVLPIMIFKGEAEAVRLANESPFGLNASVWTKDVERGRRILTQLHVGNGAVNDVIKNIGNPHLPFGGVGQSGFGRYHGIEGLRAFSRSLSVMVHQGKAPRELNWFPYSQKLMNDLKVYINMAYLKMNSWTAIRNLLGTFRAYRRNR